jgi:hypothetical protein
MVKAKREDATRPAAVRRKKSLMSLWEDKRTRMGQAIAPRLHATLMRAMRRALALGIAVPTMTFPAVSPAPIPRPTQKRAIGAAAKLMPVMAMHPMAESAAP